MAEKRISFSARIQREQFGFDSHCLKPVCTKSGQVEVAAVAGAGDEEAREAGVFLRKACFKLGPDFVTRLMNAGSDARSDVARAVFAHERNRVGEHAAQRPLPARVRCADYARVAVSEEHGRAVGAEHGENEPRRRGDERVRVRALTAPRRIDEHGFRRMHLMHAEQVIERRAEGGGDACAVLARVGGIVVRAGAGVEAGIDARAYAADAAEEAVAHVA